MTTLHRTLISDAVARPALRPYQRELVDSVINHWVNGVQNVLTVLPTGGGKTVCLSDIIYNEHGASCAIAHRQELVSQISLALARNRVRHRIIGPRNVVKMIVRLHMEEVGASYYDPNSRCAVAGVDTLVKRQEQLKDWLPTVKLWVIDECFAAGTLIDGKPISEIKVGDTVTAFNEQTGEFEQRKVMRLFKNKAPDYMVRVTTKAHHVLNCTLGHPFWTRQGWVDAGELNSDDEVLIYEMPHVREGSGCGRDHHETIFEDRERVLQSGMLQKIHVESVVGNNGANQSQVRIGTYEEKQPYVEFRGEGKDEEYPYPKRSWSENSGRQWQTSDQSGTDVVLSSQGGRVLTASDRADRSDVASEGLSEPLQDRLCEQRFNDCDRSGWSESSISGAAGTGREKNGVPYWARVDSIEVYQSRDIEQHGDCLHDGYVYNFEVEGLHTYVANGVTVHNCHHVTRENKWGTAVQMFPNARGLGVTATPCRADGYGLGRHADGVFDEMVVGPTMRDLIDMGFLTEYRIFAPPSTFHREDVKVSASTGDFNLNDMRKAVAGSSLVAHDEKTITGDIVQHYQKIAPGKLGVTFVPDIAAAEEVAAQFNAAGIPADIITGKTPDDQRYKMMRKFRSRELLQLVSVDVLGEGVDIPAIEVVSMGRPTESYGLYVQQFGRALRLLDGKLHAIIIDHVGNVARHGLPDAIREWSLDRREKRNSGKSDAEAVRTCQACTAVYERFMTACPFCGEPIPKPAQRTGPSFVDGDLFELDAATLAQMRTAVEQVDMPADEYRKTLEAKFMPHLGILAALKRHKGRQESVGVLRDLMAHWAGWERHRGLTDSEIYRKFYLTFGSDMMTAQTLKRDDMLTLGERIKADMERNNEPC